MVAHALSLAFIAVMAYMSVPGSSLFSWHPFLMTIGFVGFMFQAIMVYSKESSLFTQSPYKTKLYLHIFLQTMSTLCVLVAFLAIYYTKIEKGKQHFTSWHGLIGVTTVGYTLVQYAAGFLLGFPRLKQMLGLTSLKYGTHALYHATSGTLLYVLTCLSTGLGIYSNWFTGSAPFYIWYLAFALTCFLGLIVSMQVTSKYVTHRYPVNVKLDPATNEVRVVEPESPKSSKTAATKRGRK